MNADRPPTHHPTPRLDPLIVAHREALLALAKRHGLSNVRVFGSMARGDAHADSDVDLLEDLLPGTSGLALGGMLFDAEKLLKRRVDVLTAGFLLPAIRGRVLREAVAL